MDKILVSFKNYTLQEYNTSLGVELLIDEINDVLTGMLEEVEEDTLKNNELLKNFPQIKLEHISELQDSTISDASELYLQKISDSELFKDSDIEALSGYIYNGDLQIAVKYSTDDLKPFLYGEGKLLPDGEVLLDPYIRDDKYLMGEYFQSKTVVVDISEDYSNYLEVEHEVIIPLEIIEGIEDKELQREIAGHLLEGKVVTVSLLPC